MNDIPDLLKYILEHKDRLTRQQQKLADFILENMAEIPFLPVPVLARRSDVSEATVVRFSQRLGFDGFSSLKAAFVAHLHARNQDAAAMPPGETTLEVVLGQEIANLQKCAADNEQSVFMEVARSISTAQMVFCFGLGASSILAEYAAYLFGQIGLRASALSNRHSAVMELLVTVKPGDHLCCFSFPPYSAPTIDLIRAARARGIVTTAFSDRYSAPAARVANHCLVAPSEGMMFTNSLTALLALVNALVTEVGKQRGTRTLEAVDFINKVLEEDRGILS